MLYPPMSGDGMAFEVRREVQDPADGVVSKRGLANKTQAKKELYKRGKNRRTKSTYNGKNGGKSSHKCKKEKWNV